MADTKITGLTEETAPVTTDLLVIVDDPSGTPATKKATIANVLAAQQGEIWVPVTSMWPSTTSGAGDAVKNEYTTNDQDLYEMPFDQTSDEFAQFSIKMPGNWDASTVTFDAVWTAASSSGDVIWGLQGVAYANDDAIDTAWGTAQTSTDTLTATGDICVSPESSAITLAGTPAASEFCQFRVYRDADAGGDTLAADAQLIGITIYYNKA